MISSDAATRWMSRDSLDKSGEEKEREMEREKMSYTFPRNVSQLISHAICSLLPP